MNASSNARARLIVALVAMGATVGVSRAPAQPSALPPAGNRAAVPATAELVTAARSQIGRTTGYDPAYRKLAYPGGDVPIESGVCTDVVIRALRTAWSLDLQRLVHEDMKRDFASYPKNWGLKKPDPNIDHRRVPNLQVYFQRAGWSRAVTRVAADYQPGDIVTCRVPQTHVMIVSDRKNAAGVPLVIHNIGGGTQEEDRLFAYEITGHYRRP